MSEQIPPNRQAQAEALILSEETLRNIELSEIPLTQIALKASRIARLLNDLDIMSIMRNEAGGYLQTPTGLPPETWRLAGLAGRHFQIQDPTNKKVDTRAYTESIAQMEEYLKAIQAGLDTSRDPDIAVSSSNPSQYVFSPMGNALERNRLILSSATTAERLASRRAYIHGFVSQTYYELKYSSIADDIFVRVSRRVDNVIGSRIPNSTHRLSSLYENLRSNNPEDWSNAVHSCRRVLEDLADVVFPASQEPRTRLVDGKMKTIQLGQSHYINRILAFVNDCSESERFGELVGSHIEYLADRLNSVYKATNKGTHTTITRQEEADRYVIFTYLLVGDILSLIKSDMS